MLGKFQIFQVLTLILFATCDYMYYSKQAPIAMGIGALVEMPVLCPPGSALISVGLEIYPYNVSEIRWGYDCYESNLIEWKDEYVNYTQWNNTDTRIIWIDRHFIDCSNDYVLRGFQYEKKDADNGRFRYNCYRIKNTECHKSLTLSTGWKEIGTSATIEDLVNVPIRAFCPNCPINGFQMQMNYDTRVRPEIWYEKINYGICYVREKEEENK